MRLWWVMWLLLGSLGMAQSAAELEVLQRTNAFRQQNGLRPLQWDALAAKAALGHAQDMLQRNYFEHNSPEGTDASDRMRAAGVLEVTTGENLASFEGYPDAVIAQRSVDGWIKSPHHRDNLLQPQYTHLGVSIVRKGNKVMAVQNFLARPFDAGVIYSSVQAQRTVLVLSGTSRGTLGVFIGQGLYTRLNSPIETRLEIPPNASISYGLFDGKTWWTVQLGERGVQVRSRLETSTVAGRLVSLTLPTGSYTLAVGQQPRFWQNIYGPAQPQFRLPSTLEVLWIGVRKDGVVNYTHRIPLK